jgi:hypothetical protein
MKKLLIALLGMFAMANANAALITNGGFETGDLSGWSCTGAALCHTESYDVHSGKYAMEGFDNVGFATLSQSFATTIGSTYDLEFWSKTSNSSTGNILKYSIDGSGLTTVTTTTGWLLTQLSFVASSASTTLALLFETNPGTGVWYIDDVAVAGGVSAVPVPAALLMFAPALLGFFGFRRKMQA